MVIHEPLQKRASHENYNFDHWSAIKSSIEKVIESEINYLDEYKFTRDSGVLPEAFLSCASYFYYLVKKNKVFLKVEITLNYFFSYLKNHLLLRPKKSSKFPIRRASTRRGVESVRRSKTSSRKFESTKSPSTGSGS